MSLSTILIVKTSSLGDVIHALPALTDIQRYLPHLAVDWLVEESFSAIPKLHPNSNRVISCDLRRWRSSFWRSSTRAEWRQFLALLQVTHYDAVIDLQGLLKSVFLAKKARGVCHGYNAKSIREPLAACFYDYTYAVSKSLHAVERNRHLMAQALGYKIESLPDYGIVSPRDLERSLPVDRPYIMLLPATSRQEKYWAIDAWNTVIRWLLTQNISVVILWGSENERILAEALGRLDSRHCYVPKERQDIRTLAAWIGHAEAVVGVDTGLMHLAAALKRFTVGIYGVTSPFLAGPYPASSERVSLGSVNGFPLPQEVISVLAPLFS
jgi:heptosyltransferase I